jgi:hypothetical protein
MRTFAVKTVFRFKMLQMFGSNSTVFTFISKRYSSLQHFFVKGHKTDASLDTKIQTSMRDLSHYKGSKVMVLPAGNNFCLHFES